MQMQLLLAQQLVAFAAQNLKRRNDFHQTCHWIKEKRLGSKLTIRCGLPLRSIVHHLVFWLERTLKWY